ncbi:MAG TPA: hypothetical protein VIG06_21005 [Kofleriaceae bacterium]|jgi:hypothetical protein
MRKQYWSLAALSVALLFAAGSDAEAGKGKIRRSSGSFERTSNGVVFREKATHTKGIRSKLTFGKLGKTLSVTTEQSAGGVKSTVQRRRQRVTKAVEKNGSGTKGTSNFEKKNFFTRKWKSKMTRDDTVGAAEVTETAARKKVFGSDWEIKPPRRTGRTGNSQEFINGQARDVAPTDKSFRGKLKGKRSIERSPDTMAVTDTQTRRWGVMRRLSFGLLGKKKRVSVDQTQTADGMKVTMTTPRSKTVRETVVEDGVTKSTGTFSKRGRVRERDEVTMTAVGGARRTEKLRRDGSVKEVQTETMSATGHHIVTTKKLRKDGSVRKIKEKEALVSRDGKKRTRQRSRTTFRKDGSVRTNIGIGKVNGKRQANVKTPIGSIGTTKTRLSGEPGPAQRNPNDDE